MKFPQKYGRPGNSHNILLQHFNAVYNQNPIDGWMKGCIFPFPKKGDFGLTKNYRGITLTSIAAKIYNTLQRNRIEPKIDNILRKNQNVFRRNRPMTSQYWLSVEFLKAYGQKTSVSSTVTDIDTRLTKAWKATIGYRSYGSQTWPVK